MRLGEGCGIPNSIVESSMYTHIYTSTHTIIQIQRLKLTYERVRGDAYRATHPNMCLVNSKWLWLLWLRMLKYILFLKKIDHVDNEKAQYRLGPQVSLSYWVLNYSHKIIVATSSRITYSSPNTISRFTILHFNMYIG